MSSIHYKQTHSGLYTNFCSNLPDTYKKGAFTDLLLSIYSICSNRFIINNKFAKLHKNVCCQLLFLCTYLIMVLISFCLKLTIHAMKQMLNRNRAMLYLFRFVVFMNFNIVIFYVEL